MHFHTFLCICILEKAKFLLSIVLVIENKSKWDVVLQTTAELL